MDLSKAVEKLERDMILVALAQAKNNRSQAATLLGTKRTTLSEKIKRHSITGSEQLAPLPSNDEDFLAAMIELKRRERQDEIIRQLEATRKENERLLAELERFNERKRCGNE